MTWSSRDLDHQKQETEEKHDTSVDTRVYSPKYLPVYGWRKVLFREGTDRPRSLGRSLRHD